MTATPPRGIQATSVLASRLILNAMSTYARFACTFALGLFFTWFVLSRLGPVGFGVIALSMAISKILQTIQRVFENGLVPSLSTSIASGSTATLQATVGTALALCARATVLVLTVTVAACGAALLGAFNTPAGVPGIALALAVLVAAEGIHSGVRMLASPLVQCLYAGQRVEVDNALYVLARLLHTLSAVLVFGWWMADRALPTQLAGFAATRVTLQLVDLAVGILLVRKQHPDLRWSLRYRDPAGARRQWSTIWQSGQLDLLMSASQFVAAVYLNLTFGITYNAIFQVVLQFTGYALILGEGLTRGLAPASAVLAVEGRLTVVTSLVHRSIRYQWAFVAPICVVLWVHAEALLRLWVGERLDSAILTTAAAMAVPLLLERLLRGGFRGVEHILFGLERVHSYAWAGKWILATTLVLGFLLVQLLRQPIGAPVAMLISSAIFSPCALLLAARRELGLSLRSLLAPATAPILLALALAVLQWLSRPATGNVPMLAGSIGLSLLLYALACWFLVVRRDERRQAIALLRSSMRRGRPR